MLVDAPASSNGQARLHHGVKGQANAAIMSGSELPFDLLVIKALLTPENIAAALGLINVGLLVRRSIWNYAFGAASVALYGYVFYVSRLYSDALLQIYYFAMQFYGWWNWWHGRNKDGLARIETMSTRERAYFTGGAVVIALVLGWLFSTRTNASAPWMDASLAAASVTAQYLLSVRKLENWVLWIAADVVYIGLYYWKGLFSTAGLYAVFLVLSVFGLLEWLREIRSHDALDPVQEVRA